MILSMALSLAAQFEYRRDISGWFVANTDERDSCLVTRSYENGAQLTIVYAAGKKSLDVLLSSPNYKKIEKGKQYKIEVVFVRSSFVDDGWGEKTALGIKTDDDEGGGFGITLDAAPFLRDMRINSTLGFMLEGDVVASLRLDSSAKAMSALEECAHALAKAHPPDPFDR